MRFKTAYLGKSLAYGRVFKFHWANSSGRKLRLKAVKNTKKDTGAGLRVLCSENPPKSFHLRAPPPFLSISTCLDL
jgi:hypothetical protein